MRKSENKNDFNPDHSKNNPTFLMNEDFAEVLEKTLGSLDDSELELLEQMITQPHKRSN